MLKKIKKYKISVRPFFVLKNLKRKLNLSQIEEDLEKTAHEEISKTQALIVPSALYNTYSKSDKIEFLRPFWDSSPKAISISLIVTTIGPLLQNEIEKCQSDGDPRPAVLDSIARDALEQSMNFIVKLLSEEAKDESCELSAVLPVETVQLKEVLHSLESEKPDVILDDGGRLSPLFSAVSYCFWNPSRNKNAKSG